MIARYILTMRSMICLIIVIIGAASCDTASGTNSNTPHDEKVSLRTNASTFRTSERIKVTLSNRSGQTISFLDHQTNCTVILLQQQENDTWTNIDNCGLGIQSVWHSLKSGDDLVITLNLSDAKLAAGSYRASLNYRTSETSTSTTMLISTNFEIHE